MASSFKHEIWTYREQSHPRQLDIYPGMICGRGETVKLWEEGFYVN